MPNLQISNIQNINNYQTKAVSSPNSRNTKTSELKPDTVEISTKKNNSNNLGIKLVLGALGIGATILAFVKFHKTSTIKPKEELSAELKEIQQIYKDIFKRDINAEETKDFVQRYKKIINSKTPDNDREYCEKLLDEICRDRQTKRPEIHNWIKSATEADPRCVRGGMATAPNGHYIDIYAYNYHKPEIYSIPEKGMFESLFHETHHVKQDEICYRTDKEFFLQHLFEKFVSNGEGKMYNEMLRANGGNKEKTFIELKEMIRQSEDSYWGDLTPFQRNSVEYKEGLRLIEGKKNYKFFGDCVGDEYKNQIIEKGAYADGAKAERLFDLLKQISL